MKLMKDISVGKAKSPQRRIFQEGNQVPLTGSTRAARMAKIVDVYYLVSNWHLDSVSLIVNVLSFSRIAAGDITTENGRKNIRIWMHIAM
jgi:hypothetical protein